MRGESQTVTATIVDLTHDGEGVADIDGRRVFVPDALPGERVEIALRKRRRKLQEADLVRVLEPSPDRVTPKCEYFGRCGGCALQHLEHSAQIRFKQGVVAQALARIARAEPEQWLPPVASPPWGYRRRARLGVKYVAGKERVLVGFRERAGPYITDMRHCPVLKAPLDGMLGELADLIAGTSIRARLAQIEAAVADGVTALVLRVLETPSAADVAAFRDFAARHDLDVYLQPGGPGTSAPLGEARPLTYRLEAFGLTLQFLPTDFVQVNSAINAELVATAVRLADIEPTDRVLDLYCGLGNFSLPLAQRAKELLGVEGEAGLVARAVRNAATNGIANTRFLTADLAQTDWSFYREPWDVVVLDPPRTGAEAPIAELKRSNPRRIVYVSCHPATLARDAQVLVHERGYRLKVARVFDMFPHTHHIEALAVFERA
ncbi:MAG TPA: 23S rRNA (uracil(1939)-C(5))-methyltransferase RlmD [Gammaproteobacteria bacterium]|jgi:23S rRNA (uracil1939-C5)-methyltransferase|nr:23S rRNA (uracil(1939)-C(5))-methyltransferase RlmD [Gammaproteobacteria bacterium]